MITLKDLQNRIYSGKQCIGFDYIVKNEKNEAQFEARFRTGALTNEWKMQIVFDRTRDKDSEVYNFGYIMPRSGLPLELIAATGLKYFHLYLKEEIASKVSHDFLLGEILKGM